MSNRPARLILLIVAIGFLARDFRDVAAVAPPPVFNFTAPAVPAIVSDSSHVIPTKGGTTNPKPIPSAQPTYEQKCEGSACAQGSGSQATFNQYGAPKLVMTEAQQKAVYETVKPYAGTLIAVALLNPSTPDSTEYTDKLVFSLRAAGISVPNPAEAIQSGVGSGISIIRGNNRVKLADDIATAIGQARVLSSFPLPQQPDTIVIFVGPNH